MFRKILYPTDYSSASLKAMKYIMQMKGAGTEEVVILHVLDLSGIQSIKKYTNRFQDIFDQLKDIAVERAEKELKDIAKEFEKAGLKTHIKVVWGTPFKEILRVEEEEDVSLVVIGSHGRDAIEGVFMGSVANRVVRRSTRPVLVIRLKSEEGD